MPCANWCRPRPSDIGMSTVVFNLNHCLQRGCKRSVKYRFSNWLGVVLAIVFLALSASAQNASRIRTTVITEERKPPVTSSSAGAFLRVKYKCPTDIDPVAARVFSEYGSVLAASGIVRPDRCIYEDEKDVAAMQIRVKPVSAEIRGTVIELQKPAMLALLKAQAEAAEINRRITPLDGAIAGKRTFSDTVRLWNSRFLPALDHWVRRGRISAEDAESCRAASFAEQVRKVIQWEEQKIYFNTSMSRSIFSSVAPPGTSQHLFLLAFDVAEYSDPSVVSILNRNGWFQTVTSDQPHFTYLGLPVSELPKRGLKSAYRNGTAYWIPNLPPAGSLPK